MSFHLPPSIMIVDSDVVTRTASSNFLERSGFTAICVTSGTEAIRKLAKLSESDKPVLIIIDNILSDLSGIELCILMRSKNIDAQIMLLANNGENIEELKGEANAFDDYMIKPFHHVDLTYKIKFLLGKSKPNLKSKVLAFKDIRLNLASYKATRAGRSVHLGPTEFKLLQCFVENPTKIFTREELIGYIWSERDDVEKRTIDVHVNRLRAAMKLPGEHVPVIKTIRAAGYCLDLPERIYADAV
jgi:two-component system phosphate regulon response regulator PhoB